MPSASSLQFNFQISDFDTYYLCNYYLEYMYISFKNTLEITGEEPRLGFGLLLPDVLVVFVYSSKPVRQKKIVKLHDPKKNCYQFFLLRKNF